MAKTKAPFSEGSSGYRTHERASKRVFIAPAVAILLALSIFPLLWSLGISFTDIQRGGGAVGASADAESGARAGFLGFGFNPTARNYARLLQDQRLHTAAVNTLTYVFAGVIVQVIVGFGLALLLNHRF